MYIALYWSSDPPCITHLTNTFKLIAQANRKLRDGKQIPSDSKIMSIDIRYNLAAILIWFKLKTHVRDLVKQTSGTNA